MADIVEPRLIASKPFGTLTNDVFDDIRSNNLWPSKVPHYPRIVEVRVYFPGGLGGNGIYGITTSYQAAPDAKYEVVTHGTSTGKEGIVDLGPYPSTLYITDIIALVDKEETTLFALTFKLSDGTERGPFSGKPFPPPGKYVSAPGRAAGFYGSVCSDSHIKGLGVYVEEPVL
ncbi:hypothetical protein DXG01_002754 [Tephrocybe rancida]|nr:hypothetical protein DXG01_002754 [Tephrocybe rancida]